MVGLAVSNEHGHMWISAKQNKIETEGDTLICPICQRQPARVSLSPQGRIVRTCSQGHVWPKDVCDLTMPGNHEFIVNALRALSASELAAVLDRAALAVVWEGSDDDGVVLPCIDDDCNAPGACPNGGWCRMPNTLHLNALMAGCAANIYRREGIRGSVYAWCVYSPGGTCESSEGGASTLAEAIERTEAAAVAAGWRLPWR